MRERPPAWKKVQTVPLPGDEEDVLSWQTALAIRRDNRLTLAELGAKLCVTQRLLYGIPWCLLDDCPDCEGVAQWQRWERARRVGLI